MMQKIIYGIQVATLVVVIAILGTLVGGNQSAPATENVGGVTNFDSITLSEGLNVVGTTTSTGLTVTDAGIRHSFTNGTTSTDTAYTLTENDLAPGGKCYESFDWTKAGSVASSTLTFGATSTMPNLLPASGDWCEMVFTVSTTSEANPGLIFAAGTGWQLGTSSTTATGLTLNGGQNAKVLIKRLFNTNLSASITVFRDGH